MDSVALFRYTHPVRMELLLPVDGPGAAPLNPARAAEARHFHAQYGVRKAGDSRALDLSLIGGIKGRFYAGAFFTGANGRFDYSKALILDNRIGTQAAYRHPLGDGGDGHVAFGLAQTFRFVDGMADFKDNSMTTDFGILFVPSRRLGGWGLEFGAAARDLLPFQGSVPRRRIGGDGSRQDVRVDFAPWLGTGSVLAASPARRWSLFGSAALGAEYVPAYWEKPLPGWDAGPVRAYLPRIGGRYRPVPQASFALERVWSSHWVLDATLGTGKWLPVHGDANLRFAYGPNLQYRSPERTGWSLGWNLAFGI